MRHRHQGHYKSRTRKGIIHKRKPLHPIRIRKVRKGRLRVHDSRYSLGLGETAFVNEGGKLLEIKRNSLLDQTRTGESFKIIKDLPVIKPDPGTEEEDRAIAKMERGIREAEDGRYSVRDEDDDGSWPPEETLGRKRLRIRKGMTLFPKGDIRNKNLNVILRKDPFATELELAVKTPVYSGKEKASVKAQRYGIPFPRKMPAGWSASKRYRGWTEIPVPKERVERPRQILIPKKYNLGIANVYKMKQLPTRLIRNDKGKIVGVARW